MISNVERRKITYYHKCLAIFGVEMFNQHLNSNGCLSIYTVQLNCCLWPLNPLIKKTKKINKCIPYVIVYFIKKFGRINSVCRK